MEHIVGIMQRMCVVALAHTAHGALFFFVFISYFLDPGNGMDLFG